MPASAQAPAHRSGSDPSSAADAKLNRERLLRLIVRSEAARKSKPR